MKVAFWSNARGKSCVTSNLACISVLSALRNAHSAQKTILFENHQNIINLGSTLFRQSEGNVVREPGHYAVETGLARILKLIELGQAVSEESIYRSAKDYLGKRLFYLPSEENYNADFLEYQLEKECAQALRCLERCSSLVMVDTSAAPLASSREILRQADMVVVNLSQNYQMLSQFFSNYSGVQKKAFYLIGNYDRDSNWTKSKIMKSFNIPGNRIAAIPHHVRFADAVSEGKIIPFLLKHYLCEKRNENFAFISAAKEAVELFLNQLQIMEAVGVGREG